MPAFVAKHLTIEPGLYVRKVVLNRNLPGTVARRGGYQLNVGLPEVTRPEC